MSESNYNVIQPENGVPSKPENLRKINRRCKFKQELAE
jgi:hypothetical protein